MHESPTRLDLGLMINRDADHSVKFDAKLARARLVSWNFCLFRFQPRASGRTFEVKIAGTRPTPVHASINANKSKSITTHLATHQKNTVDLYGFFNKLFHHNPEVRGSNP